MTSTLDREDLADAVVAALTADRGTGYRKYLAKASVDISSEGDRGGVWVDVRLVGKGRPELIGRIVITGTDGACEAENECDKGRGDIDSILRSL